MCLEGIFFTSFDLFCLSFVVCVAGINVTSAISFHMELFFPLQVAAHQSVIIVAVNTLPAAKIPTAWQM